MAKKETMEGFDVTSHILVPKHEVCSAAEKQRILDRYRVVEQKFPRIPAADPAIQHLGAKPGDLIKITRNSPTAGETTFFRIVSLE